MLCTYIYHHMFTGGSDYEAGPYNVTIPKGERSANYCINITNDEELEMDEAFVIEINVNKLHPDVVLMQPMETRVTIMDDECKYKDCTCQYYIGLQACLHLHIIN